MLSVITPTGGRPEAFAVLAECIRRQTCRDFEWVIVDDCDPETDVPAVHDRITRVRPQPRWQPGQNTQARNLLEGIKAARGDAIAVMEDDDWYCDEWIAQCIEWASEHELAGEGDSHYYNVANGTGRAMCNTRHASLCATVLRGAALDRLVSICRDGGKLIDCRLWAGGGHFEPWRGRVVGIKGMPGRPGIGVGHQLVGERFPITDWIPDWNR